MENVATVTEYMGYTVEQKPDATHGGALAYVLTGARGAVYGLMRDRRLPHLMFVVRGSNGHICDIKGNYTFTDAGGNLRARS